MNKIKVMFLAFLTMLAMTLALASPANAATQARCWPSGAPSGANLNVTKYPDPAGRGGYEYHYHVYSVQGWQGKGISFDGSSFGGSNESYIYKNDNLAHTIKGRWLTSSSDFFFYVYCSVRL